MNQKRMNESNEKITQIIRFIYFKNKTQQNFCCCQEMILLFLGLKKYQKFLFWSNFGKKYKVKN